jgi:tetratricopeptide (TPR) repeat protein
MINQANVLMRLGRFAEALALYNSVIALPGTANSGHGRLALFNRALAYRALGELELAHADLAQAGAADIGGTGTVEAIPSGGLLPISPQ